LDKGSKTWVWKGAATWVVNVANVVNVVGCGGGTGLLLRKAESEEEDEGSAREL